MGCQTLLKRFYCCRSDTIDVSIVTSLQDLVNQDPGRSMISLAKELIISDASVRNKLAQDICYKSYALKHGLFLNQTTKGRRLTKVKLMLKGTVARDCRPLVFFNN
jgi:hypothetical protein